MNLFKITQFINSQFSLDQCLLIKSKVQEIELGGCDVIFSQDPSSLFSSVEFSNPYLIQKISSEMEENRVFLARFQTLPDLNKAIKKLSFTCLAILCPKYMDVELDTKATSVFVSSLKDLKLPRISRRKSECEESLLQARPKSIFVLRKFLYDEGFIKKIIIPFGKDNPLSLEIFVSKPTIFSKKISEYAFASYFNTMSADRMKMSCFSEKDSKLICWLAQETGSLILEDQFVLADAKKHVLEVLELVASLSSTLLISRHMVFNLYEAIAKSTSALLMSLLGEHEDRKEDSITLFSFIIKKELKKRDFESDLNREEKVHSSFLSSLREDGPRLIENVANFSLITKKIYAIQLPPSYIFSNPVELLPSSLEEVDLYLQDEHEMVYFAIVYLIKKREIFSYDIEKKISLVKLDDLFITPLLRQALASKAWALVDKMLQETELRGLQKVLDPMLLLDFVDGKTLLNQSLARYFSPRFVLEMDHGLYLFWLNRLIQVQNKPLYDHLLSIRPLDSFQLLHLSIPMIEIDDYKQFENYLNFNKEALHRSSNHVVLKNMLQESRKYKCLNQLKIMVPELIDSLDELIHVPEQTFNAFAKSCQKEQLFVFLKISIDKQRFDVFYDLFSKRQDELAHDEKDYLLIKLFHSSPKETFAQIFENIEVSAQIFEKIFLNALFNSLETQVYFTHSYLKTIDQDAFYSYIKILSEYRTPFNQEIAKHLKKLDVPIEVCKEVFKKFGLESNARALLFFKHIPSIDDASWDKLMVDAIRSRNIELINTLKDLNFPRLSTAGYKEVVDGLKFQPNLIKETLHLFPAHLNPSRQLSEYSTAYLFQDMASPYFNPRLALKTKIWAKYFKDFKK